MDKNEYNEKLQEIKRLVAQENYGDAAQVADSIDWKRVRNVQTLVMVSEIYEAVERYEDSKILLQRAYRRTPLGRTVLYRLVEITIKLKQFDEAIEYYTEYVQAAPHDNNRYILKYKIYRGRGSSVDEQIDILREYLSQEYTEKWAYELAKLYIQAGRTQEAISQCDDLVLWFHSGKYVMKALELKKKYAPLTPKQQEIYEQQLQGPADAEPADESDLQSEIAQGVSEAVKTAPAAERTAIRTEPEAERPEAVPAAGVAGEAAERQAAEPEQEEDGKPAGHHMKMNFQFPWKKKTDGSEPAAKAAAGTAEEGSVAAGSMAVDMTAQQASGSTDVLNAVEEDRAASQSAADSAPYAQTAADDETARSAEAAAEDGAAVQPDSAAEAAETPAAEIQEGPEEEGLHYDEKSLQSDLVRSMREVVAGVGKVAGDDSESTMLDEVIDRSREDQELAVARDSAEAAASEAAQAAASAASPAEAGAPAAAAGTEGASGADARTETAGISGRPTAKKLTIDDILLSMSDKGASVRRAVNPPARDGVISAVEEARLNERSDSMTANAREEIADRAKQAQEEIRERARRAAQELDWETPDAAETAAAPDAGIAAGTDTDSAAETAPGTEPAAAAENDSESAEPAGVDLSAENQGREMSGTDQSVQVETPAEDSAAEQADRVSARADAAASQAGRAAERPAGPAVGVPLPETPAGMTDEIAQAATKVIPTAEIAALHRQFMEESRRSRGTQDGAPVQRVQIVPGTMTDSGTEEAAVNAASGAAGTSGTANEPAGMPVRGDAPAAQKGDEAEVSMPESAGREQGGLQEGFGPANGGYGRRQMLQDYQRELFRGFVEIPGMEEQIARAIANAEAKGGDRTSRTGNILILGGHGCGKTTIALGIAKAIAEDRGSRSLKMAKIYAADLNRKDIAATIAKIAGGILIIEEAGDLDDGIVDQLTTAMEFRTDGLIIILEDEQRFIHELLMRHPRFTMKFNSQICLPDYTAEDLVRFGKIAAEKQDYVFSEGAAATLNARIQEASAGGNTVSVTNVTELVDRAIRNANKFFRRMTPAKKRYDSQDRVILIEKDFR